MCVDVGTNNEQLLRDPLYLGWRHKRLEGDEYWEFMEKFVLGVKRNFPEALVQWEDFAKHKAFTLLERYQERVLSFDDDIQGTGAVALAALMTAMRIKKTAVRRPALRDRRHGPGRRRHRDEHPRAAEGRGAERRGGARAHLRGRSARASSWTTCRGCRSGSTPFAQPRAAVAGWKLRNPDEIRLMDVDDQREADGAHRRHRAARALQRRSALDDGVLREAADRPGALEPDQQVRVHRRKKWSGPRTEPA